MSYQYITSTGVIVPDTSTILTDAGNEYKAVFGNDLNLTPSTPQGRLVDAETTARKEVVNNNAELANQINPNEAGGNFLDAVMALTGIERDAAVATVVHSVSIAGVPGTVISQGALAQTAAGDQFTSLAAVTIAANGTASVDFASVDLGPIPAPIGALNQIVSAVLGWETVTNPTAGILGQSTQSDVSARAYRNNTLGFQGVSLPVAITSALYATPGVLSLTFQENITATSQTINGISMVAHSIYACVDGGSDLAVASALLENKSAGCAWNGGTTINVTEPASGQVYPVQFDRPTAVGILVRVTTTNGNAANIEQAVLDYFATLKVGDDVSTFEISGTIIAEYDSYYIKNVEISLSTGTPSYQNAPIVIGVNQKAYTQLSYLNVVVSP